MLEIYCITEIPQHFVYRDNKWNPRKRGANRTIAQMCKKFCFWTKYLVRKLLNLKFPGGLTNLHVCSSSAITWLRELDKPL